MSHNYTLTGLTPNTNYGSVQVAGVNVNGTGPYGHTLSLRTDREGIIHT